MRPIERLRACAPRALGLGTLILLGTACSNDCADKADDLVGMQKKYRDGVCATCGKTSKSCTDGNTLVKAGEDLASAAEDANCSSSDEKSIDDLISQQKELQALWDRTHTCY